MDYIVKHYHTLRNQPFIGLTGAIVLLIEPEPETRAFYSQQLRDIGMEVKVADALINILGAVQEASPDVVILNPSEDMASASKAIKQLRREFGDLPVITMTLTMREDQLDAIMEAGVSLHINRGLTRPRDLLLALEQVMAKK